MSRVTSARTGVFGFTLALVLALAACGGGAEPTAAPKATPTTAAAATAPATPTTARPQATATPAATPTSAPAPTAATSGDTPKRGGTLASFLSREVRGVDPQVTFTIGDLIGYGGAYDPLIRLDPAKAPAASFLPNVATSWEFSQDGKSLVLKIKQGVKFHDGNPLTMDDILFTFDRALNGKASKVNDRIRPYIASAEAVDPSTLKVNLVWPPRPSEVLAFMSAVELKIVPKHVFSRDEGNVNKAIGSGPFKMQSFTPQRAVWVRNDTYHRPNAPLLDSVEWTLIADAGTQLAGYRTGKLHIWPSFPALDLDPALQVEKETGGKMRVIKAPSNGGHTLFINPHVNPALKDARVRQAIFLAIDRHDYVKRLFSGEGLPGAVLNSDIYGEAALSPSELAKLPGLRQPKDEDIKAAQDLVKQAGFTGAEIKILARTYAGLPDASSLIAVQIGKTGLKITIEQIEPNAGLQRMGNADFDMTIGSYGALTANSQMFNIYSEGHSWNFGKVVDPKIKELKDAYLAAWNEPLKQTQIAKDFQRYLETPGTPWIALHIGTSVRVINTNLRGHAAPPISYSMTEMDNYWWVNGKAEF